jgi:hypothetical protein
MKHFVGSLLRVALVATLLFSTILRLEKVKALDCRDVNLVFLRGSSQNYAVESGRDINYPVWTKGTDNKVIFEPKINEGFLDKEKESAAYFEGIGNQILAEYPALSMQFVTLHNFENKYNAYGYRAVPAFGSGR